MAKPAPIVFVVRASIRDGLGHLVRSLSVLRALLPLHPAQLLLLGDGSGRHLVEAVDVPCTPCATDDAAVTEIRKRRARLVVFDTLSFDSVAFDHLPAGVQTASISPVFSQMARVNHLFHRTVKDDPAWPRSRSFPKVHKGLRYAVLPAWLKRMSTRHYREQVDEERLAVAISMGGTDAANRTLALLKHFGQCRARLVLFVALGDAYKHSYEELLACASANRQEIILLKSNESMWRVLKTTVSLIVCAGGLTTYEAAFVGLPTINILNSHEWGYLFEELVEAGACRMLPPGDSSLKQAVKMVESLAANRGDLTAMHLATKGLIPEGGARRIATKLHSLLTSD